MQETETTQQSLQEKILAAFENNQHRTGNKVEFHPEVKVKRDDLTYFISQIRKTAMNSLHAVVEVQTAQGLKDKAPMPLGILDEISLKAIYFRLI